MIWETICKGLGIELGTEYDTKLSELPEQSDTASLRSFLEDAFAIQWLDDEWNSFQTLKSILVSISNKLTV